MAHNACGQSVVQLRAPLFNQRYAAIQPFCLKLLQFHGSSEWDLAKEGLGRNGCLNTHGYCLYDCMAAPESACSFQHQLQADVFMAPRPLAVCHRSTNAQ